MSNTWSDFLFLRHGQTDWNLAGRFQGTVDVPLNQTGARQARDAAAHLSRQQVDRIVSSPLIRALKTAAIVSEHISVPINLDHDLIERSFGAFEGLVVKEVKRRIGVPAGEPIAPHLPPEAEQWSDTKVRNH